MQDAQAPEVAGYDVGRLLGRGGSADVWLAREQRSGTDYALKCFRADGARRRATVPGVPVSEEDVRREIRILSVLDHQHLVRAHAALRTAGPGGGTALKLDYASGGSLGQLVAARGRLSVGETVTVLTPIAQALGYLHSKGFTHSDVSPGNVLFTGQGKPMLSDVGVARILGDPGGAGAGTAGFLDPMPVDAVRAGLQPERDVYSAAAVGWYCLTGEPPGRTADRPPLSLLVPAVPKELAAVLEAGLNEDRRLRPSALALATAVYRSAEPQPLDLSPAVHPTVLPELLTRRHVPAESKGTRLRIKLQALRRRVVAARWDAEASSARSPRKPLGKADGPGGQHAPGEKPALRGKHADVPVAGPGMPVLRRAALPAVAAAAAGLWLLWGAGGQGILPGSAATGSTHASASPPATTAVPEALTDRGGERTAGLNAARMRATAADPAVAVQGLAALRDYAFSSGRLELLADVNAPGSAAAAADDRIAAELHPSRHRLAGFTSTLSEVAAEEGATGARAVVRVVSATTGYRTTTDEDNVLATGAPSPPRPLRLVLVSVEGRWRVSDVLPGP